METAQLDKRERIISTALEVFRRFGYNKTSIADIASEARLGKGTIYYYFDSKEDIYVEILKQQGEMVAAQTKEMIEEVSDIGRKIKRFIVKPLEFLINDAPLLLEVFSNANDEFLRKISAFKQRFHDQSLEDFQALLEKGQKEGVIRADLDPAEITRILHSWLHYWMNNIYCKKLDFDLTKESLNNLLQEYEVLIDLILHGLIAKEAK